MMEQLLFCVLFLVAITPSFCQVGRSSLADDLAFSSAVSKTLRFQPHAQRLGNSVRVYVGFTLTDKGIFSDVSVLNSTVIDESLKQEVDRVLHKLPDQEPKRAGNYILPIAFMLGEDGPSRLKKPVNESEAAPVRKGYRLLNEVSVIGFLECERKALTTN